MTTAYDTSPAAGSRSEPTLDSAVAALRAAYERTVHAIMSDRFGQDWATRDDLPDEAYTTEIVFVQWLSDLLDHLDSASSANSHSSRGCRETGAPRTTGASRPAHQYRDAFST